MPQVCHPERSRTIAHCCSGGCVSRKSCDSLTGGGIVRTERTKIQTVGSLPNGGRRYVREFAGRVGGRARYIKEVDASERTVRFLQEIYDVTDRLVAMHSDAREISRRFGL
jgi:hypothetical protein